MEYFIHVDIEGEDIACEFQHLLLWTSYQQLFNVLNKNLIINCQVLSDDVQHAHVIYILATAILKG